MKQSNPKIEAFRVREGRMASDESYGNNGVFVVRYGQHALQIIASDGMDWDHVSVVPIDRKNLRKLWRTPTWEEMCFVKDLFFEPDECVIQYHPSRDQYRNAHEYCLHLWRPQSVELPVPNPVMVA